MTRRSNLMVNLAAGMIVGAILLVLLSLSPGTVAVEATTPVAEKLDFHGNMTAWIEEEPDTATGTAYMLYEHHGGYWADAEKGPGDDGVGNPAAVSPDVDTPGDEDDLACWAATCSNMLEWTGWGFTGGMGGTDDFFDYYIGHTTDYGSLNVYGLEWWFNGNLPTHTGGWSAEDVDVNGFWSSSYTWTDHVEDKWNGAGVLPDIANGLKNGYTVGLGIYPITPPGGHAITCWGFNYDNSKNPSTDPQGYYLGIWVSDSDSHKGQTDPDDYLRYYEVDYDSTNGYWYMPNYGGGWKIDGVTWLHPFPGEFRPVANDGGAYTKNEGTSVTFSGSGSSDPDGDPLKYRWDYDGDGDWDSSWSTTASTSQTWYDDFSSDVYLEVFDGRLRDMDITTVTINNVPPTISASGCTINENGFATINGNISDPGTLDTFTLEINWGEGSPQSYALPAGSTTFSKTHQYLDDFPTATSSDVLTIGVKVTDDDGGVGTATTLVRINNVAPSVTSTGATINENGIATVSGSITDPGSLDTFTLEINWGEGSPQTYTLPAGTKTYSRTHQYLDDNPTLTLFDTYSVSVKVTDDDKGVGTSTTSVRVNNVDPMISGITMDQPNPQFILPLVHTLDFIGVFSDTGTLDTHTAVWDWDDGTTSTGTIVETGGSGTVTSSHIFSLPGTYIVELTVIDDDGGRDGHTFTVEVADAYDAIEDLNDYIQGLDDSCFKNNADNRKGAIDEKTTAALKMLKEEAYKGLIKLLSEDIRDHADGLVDGKTGDDWIIDQTAQDHICMKIDDIVAYLKTFL